MSLVQACKIPLPYAVLIALVALVFFLFPQLDLVISGWMFDAASGHFWFAQNPAVEGINFILHSVNFLFVLAVMAGVAWAWHRRHPAFPLAKQLGVYLVVLFLMGPILAVSMGFKEHWGRARPAQVESFGGHAQFTPYYQPTNQCESDCSFMSGHTARSFYFISLYFLAVGAGLAAAHQRAVLGFAVAYGSFAALLRLFEGRHFASDVLASAILTMYLAWVLYRWLQPFTVESRITLQQK